MRNPPFLSAKRFPRARGYWAAVQWDDIVRCARHARGDEVSGLSSRTAGIVVREYAQGAELESITRPLPLQTRTRPAN